MKALRWCVINGGFAALLIAGFGYGVVGAAACATFAVWFYTICSLLLLAVPLAERNKALRAPVPMWLDAMTDVTILGIMVWTGHWFLGIMYLVSVLSVHHFNTTVKPLEPVVS